MCHCDSATRRQRFLQGVSISRVQWTMFLAGACVSKNGSWPCWQASFWIHMQNTETQISLTCIVFSLTHTQYLFRLWVCVCVYFAGRRCRSIKCGRACSIQTTTWAAPWQRAAKPSSSTASPQRSWEVSVLTERVKGRQVVGLQSRVWGILASHVSLLEQWSYNASILPGKRFPFSHFIRSWLDAFPIMLLLNYNQSQT